METKEKDMKLNDFRLLVNDFAASFHFWHEIVGLSTIFRDENNIYAAWADGRIGEPQPFFALAHTDGS